MSTDKLDFQKWNESFKSLSPRERLERVIDAVPADRILVTSSFGASSYVLLHLISQVKPDLPIHFVDTSFLFPETITYREQLANQLGLTIYNVQAPEAANNFASGEKLWNQNPDLCCSINKVQPLNAILPKYDIWISGLLGYQNANRRNLNFFEPKDQLQKFHPIIDLTAENVALYRHIYELPTHPLVPRGYNSIGCTHCTKKGQGREGRWIESTKTECGIHV